MHAVGGPDYDLDAEIGYITIFGRSDKCYFGHLRTDWNQLANSSAMACVASWVGTLA